MSLLCELIEKLPIPFFAFGVGIGGGGGVNGVDCLSSSAGVLHFSSLGGGLLDPLGDVFWSVVSHLGGNYPV